MATRRLEYVENAASGTITGAVTVAAASCVITNASLLDANYNKRFAVWNRQWGDAATARENSEYEIVLVTAVSAGVATITKGQDGTDDIAWPISGGQVWQWDCVATKAQWNDIDAKLDTALSEQNTYQFDVTQTAYGAVGDVPDSPTGAQLAAATDATAAIQSAIDAAAANVGGGTVVVPEGGYKINSNSLVISSPFVKLKLLHGAKLYQATAGSNVLEIRDTTDVKVEGGHWYGVGGDGETSTNNDNAIEIKDTSVASPTQGSSARVSISDVIAHDFRFCAVFAEFCDDLLVENCKALGCRQAFEVHACRRWVWRNLYTDASMLAESSTTLGGTYGVFSGGIGGNDHTGSHDDKHSENGSIINCMADGRNNQQSLIVHDSIGLFVVDFQVDEGISGITMAVPGSEANAVLKDIQIISPIIKLRDTSSALASPTNYGIMAGGASGQVLDAITITSPQIRGANKALDNQGEGGIAFNGFTRNAKVLGGTIQDSKGFGIGFSTGNHEEFYVGAGINVRDTAAATSDPGASVILRTGVGGTSTGILHGIQMDGCQQGIRTEDAAASVSSYGHTFGDISAANQVVGTFDEDLPRVRGDADIDGNLNVDGTLTVDLTSTLTGAVSAPAGVTANITGDITGSVTGANSDVLQMGDCEFHRDAANIIGTADSLKVDAGLEVDGTTQLDGATTANADVTFNNAAIFGGAFRLNPTARTLVSDACAYAPWIEVTHEGAGPNDTLSTITGGTKGDLVMVTIASGFSGTLTIDTAAPAGNLNAAGGDFAAGTTSDTWLARFDGTNWQEILRQDNPA